MPGSQTITNPNNAYVTISDYTTGQDDHGGDLAYGHRVETFVASADIAKGHVVKLDNMTTTTGLTASPAVGGTDAAILVVGIAKNAAAEGDLVEVVVHGYALAQGDGSVTAGSALDFDANSRVATEALDATDVVGTIVGRALAADGSAGDLFPVWVMRL